MTDDIAARLRRWSKTFGKPTGNGRTNPDNDMIYLLDDAADEIEALRAFRERDKGEIESLRETVETLMRGSRTGELIDEANTLRDDLRQATTKLGAAEARVRELEAVNAALNERSAQYERLYRNAQAETIERCAKKAKSYDDGVLIYDAQGRTIPSRHGTRIAAAIRKLAQEVKHEAE